MDYEGLSILEDLRARLLVDRNGAHTPEPRQVMPLPEAADRLRRVPGNRLALFSVVQHVEDALCSRSDVGASPLALQLVTVLSFQIRQLVASCDDDTATDPGALFTAIELACAPDAGTAADANRFDGIRSFMPSRENAAFWIRNFGRERLSVDVEGFIDACVREIPDAPDARDAEAAAVTLARRIDLNGDGRIDAAEFAVTCPAFVGDELRECVDDAVATGEAETEGGASAADCRRCSRLEAELTLERRRNELLRQRIRRLENPPGSAFNAPSMVGRHHGHRWVGAHRGPHHHHPQHQPDHAPTVAPPPTRTSGDWPRAANASSIADLESGRLRRLAVRARDFAPAAKGHTADASVTPVQPSPAGASASFAATVYL